jgi:hypothetical protein
MTFHFLERLSVMNGFITNSWVLIAGEELDGRAVSALGVRSRKLSTGLNGQF